MLTSSTPAAYTQGGGYIKNESKALARDALGHEVAAGRQRDVVNILTAAERNGLPGLTTREIADQYRFLTGNSKAVPGDFTDAISKLRAASCIAFAGRKLNTETGKSADSWQLVAQQTRLAA